MSLARFLDRTTVAITLFLGLALGAGTAFVGI
jgi:hypothetical protein